MGIGLPMLSLYDLIKWGENALIRMGGNLPYYGSIAPFRGLLCDFIHRVVGKYTDLYTFAPYEVKIKKPPCQAS
jgi:hypothetical protein